MSERAEYSEELMKFLEDYMKSRGIPFLFHNTGEFRCAECWEEDNESRDMVSGMVTNHVLVFRRKFLFTVSKTREEVRSRMAEFVARADYGMLNNATFEYLPATGLLCFRAALDCDHQPPVAEEIDEALMLLQALCDRYSAAMLGMVLLDKEPEEVIRIVDHSLEDRLQLKRDLEEAVKSGVNLREKFKQKGVLMIKK